MNTSFFSPSVLDRLNPLLEPNGLLSIDERGIVGDTVPTIIPHPKFRLVVYFVSSIFALHLCTHVCLLTHCINYQGVGRLSV
jgi:hypothetical protein